MLELNLKGTVSGLVDKGCGKGIPGRGKNVKSQNYEKKKHNQGVLQADEDCWDTLNMSGAQVKKQVEIIL